MGPGAKATYRERQWASNATSFVQIARDRLDIEMPSGPGRAREVLGAFVNGLFNSPTAPLKAFRNS